MQILGEAQAEAMRHVERRRSPLGMRIVGVLREPLRNGPRGTCAADHHAGVVNGFAPRVACLQAGPLMTNVS